VARIEIHLISWNIKQLGAILFFDCSNSSRIFGRSGWWDWWSNQCNSL